ncbi:hypothetical protein [Desulfosporosinus burensis]
MQNSAPDGHGRPSVAVAKDGEKRPLIEVGDLFKELRQKGVFQ